MDLWDGVKSALTRIAPIAANAIIPGAGGLVGSLLSGVLGVDNEPQAIEQALRNATPVQIAKIEELQNKHEERLIELATQNDKLYLQDRQDARAREKAIVEATGEKDTNLYWLAWITVAGFFATLIVVIVVDLPASEAARTALAMLLGALVSSYKDVLGYFFGSSKSSADKTKLMIKK